MPFPYEPPAANAVNFTLAPYTAPPRTAVNFELGYAVGADWAVALDRTAYFVRAIPSDGGAATDSAFFPSRLMPLGDTASGQDARVWFRATHTRGDTGLTTDVSTLLATLVRNDQVTLTVTEVGTLAEASFLSSDTGSGTETVQWIARGFYALTAEDGGIGTESLPALSTLLSALQIARGTEQVGEIEALAIVEDVGDGTDKVLYVFTKHFGAPWGATKVRLEAVQEK